MLIKYCQYRSLFRISCNFSFFFSRPRRRIRGTEKICYTCGLSRQFPPKISLPHKFADKLFFVHDKMVGAATPSVSSTVDWLFSLVKKRPWALEKKLTHSASKLFLRILVYSRFFAQSIPLFSKLNDPLTFFTSFLRRFKKKKTRNLIS